ncbi:glutathione peroxidase [Rhizobium mulingense]|uniref:glutathione peroxidase n=1 Tax=Rhizobium mulingense TaxID=3031128 RepID=UPI002B469C34|nr:glutathione peroxidase [Rhizobium sp. MJ21]MEB3046992.1 glutathione peroxidase [Rhizobium sp. MJ21]
MTANVLDIPVKSMDGRETTLNHYKGRVVLIVNVASKCGLTPQYEGLEKLYGEKRERGFVIAAFPANDFKGQEPGTDAEILDFCTSTYDVTFPIFSKISVKGETQHPLYRQLTKSGVKTTGDGPMRDRLKAHGIAGGDEDDILWNFEKFLIGRDGKVVARFAPDVTADDSRLVSAVDKELAKG